MRTLKHTAAIFPGPVLIEPFAVEITVTLATTIGADPLIYAFTLFQRPASLYPITVVVTVALATAMRTLELAFAILQIPIALEPLAIDVTVALSTALRTFLFYTFTLLQ